MTGIEAGALAGSAFVLVAWLVESVHHRREASEMRARLAETRVALYQLIQSLGDATGRAVGRGGAGAAAPNLCRGLEYEIRTELLAMFPEVIHPDPDLRERSPREVLEAGAALMAARLWKPLEREIALDGQRFILRIELGGGSAAGDVMVRVRRVGAHSWSFTRNLTLALRTALASGARVQTLNL